MPEPGLPVEPDTSPLGTRLAREEPVRELVADFDRMGREILRHRAGEATGDDVVVVHLPGVGDDSSPKRLCERAIFTAWVMPPTRFVSNWSTPAARAATISGSRQA